MLNDSGFEIDEEFLDDFVEDSSIVLKELEECMSSFQGIHDTHLFEKYGQQIDRIMGAAYTLSFDLVGDLARFGKELGYKASQVKDISKLLALQGILSQLLRALDSILKSMKKGTYPERINYKDLLTRLKKASEALGDLRGTVKVA